MTQNQIVKKHLEEIGSITAKEAAEKYNIWRLAGRIHELRQSGMVIGVQDVPTTTGGTFARYFKQTQEGCSNG